MAFYELRQYFVRPGKMDEWVKIMEEEIIPFQVSKGMVICGSFRGETDESAYFWLRRFNNEAEREAQLAAFERQLAIAAELGKPLFLHQRDAHEDFLALLRRWRDRVPAMVVHCFTDTREALHDYLALDCHIGITGWICDERRGSHLREFVREIPADRLMIETDSPYLLPRTVRPQPSHRRNEPMYLKHICEEIARDRGEPVEVTAANSTVTAEAFFGLA